MSIYYTVYDERTDNILAFGTDMMCCKMLGIGMSSFRSITSRARRGDTKKYAVVEDRTPYEELFERPEASDDETVH